MKTLKYFTIFTYLFILSSCQNEVIDAEEQVIDTSGIELIEESYASDLELYKDTPIVFENSEHNIKEVLTDLVLFNKYKNAQVHYLKGVEDINILYVTPENVEASEKMMAEIKSKETKKALGVWECNVSVTIWDNDNYSGSKFIHEESYTFVGESGGRRMRKWESISSARKNKGNSFKFTSSTGSNVNSAVLRIFSTKDNNSDDYDNYTLSKQVAKMNDQGSVSSNDAEQFMYIFWKK